LVQHLVALVQHETLEVAQIQFLLSDKSVQTAGRSDNNIGIVLLIAKELNVLLDRRSSVENGGLHVRQVLAEPSILVFDLVGKLARVAHNQNLAFSLHWLQLVQRRQDKDGRLTQTGLGLAEDIDIEDSRRDTDLLHCSKATDVRDDSAGKMMTTNRMESGTSARPSPRLHIKSSRKCASQENKGGKRCSR